MLETEADLLRTLRSGTYTLDELYALCETAVDISRDNGHSAVSDRHRTDSVWRHRVRGWLANAKAKGLAERVDRATWLIQGTVENPPRGWCCSTPARISPVSSCASRTPSRSCTPSRSPRTWCSAIRPTRSGEAPGTSPTATGTVATRPRCWTATSTSTRPRTRSSPSVGSARPPRSSAMGANSPSSPDPSRPATSSAAEQAELTWVSQIVARKVFPAMTSRRPSCAHWCATILCRGPLNNPKRVFNTPADLPKAASGADYPLDWWHSNGRADRPGLLRYDNALPLPLVSRLVNAFSDPGHLVVDPMLGSGTTAVAAHLAGRRFIGGDLNPAAVRFAAARLLDEHLWPAWRQPALFAA